MTASEFKARPGLAWYVGRQADDNSVTSGDTEYLTEPPQHVIARCRYAAHLATLRWDGQDLTVVYYVDPDSRRVFAQPHPASASFHLADWGLRRPELRPFEDARAFARKLLRLPGGRGVKPSEFPYFWRSYVSWEPRKGFLPPPPLDVPAVPDAAYVASGWVDFRDWLRAPPKKKSGKGGKGKKAVVGA